VLPVLTLSSNRRSSWSSSTSSVTRPFVRSHSDFASPVGHFDHCRCTCDEVALLMYRLLFCVSPSGTRRMMRSGTPIDARAMWRSAA